MRKIDKIIIHCSDSSFGSAKLIDQWHKEKGFDGIGYHFVITNGVLTKNAKYEPDNDSLIQVGRDINDIGAHCRGHNEYSIGICLIGKAMFTGLQFDTLFKMLKSLMNLYDLSENYIFGHNEFSKKTCPNIDINFIKKFIG